MITVIKHGKETFKAVCPICGCEFTYQSEDLKEDCFHNHYVDCPDCKQVVIHEYEDKKKDITWGKDLPLVTNSLNWPDCDKCPNKPNSDKPIIGDSPCALCKKMQPYCYTSDIFPESYKRGKYADLNIK